MSDNQTTKSFSLEGVKIPQLVWTCDDMGRIHSAHHNGHSFQVSQSAGEARDKFRVLYNGAVIHNTSETVEDAQDVAQSKLKGEIYAAIWGALRVLTTYTETPCTPTQCNLARYAAI